MATIILAFVCTISIVCIQFYIDFLIIYQSLLVVVSVRTAFLEQLVILPVFVICWMQDWERSEKGICGSLEKLRAFKKQLSQPIPDHNEDLQAEQIRCKVTT